MEGWALVVAYTLCLFPGLAFHRLETRIPDSFPCRVPTPANTVGTSIRDILISSKSRRTQTTADQWPLGGLRGRLDYPMNVEQIPP